MRTDTIIYYDFALMDVKTNSIPERKTNGKYQWSNGQMSILNAQYKELASLYVHLDRLKLEGNDVLNEIISFEEPSRQLLTDNCTHEIDEEIIRVKERKSLMQQERQQLEEDMFNRGIVLSDEIHVQPFENAEIIEEYTQEETDEKVLAKIQRLSKFRHILQFFTIWLTGEVFLTAIQWSVLRDDKSIEDMIIRSLAFGVCLGLFHFISYKNKKQYRWEYVAFLGVSLTMIFIMLFGPLVINTLYPIVSVVDMVNFWDLSGGQGNEFTEYPIWIEVFRRYDVVIPSAITFFAFLIMESFLKEKATRDIASDDVDSDSWLSNITLSDSIEEEDTENPIENRFRLLTNCIKDSDKRIEKLEKDRLVRLNPNTANLYAIEERITKLKLRIHEIEDEIPVLENHRNSLINELFSQLEKYRTDFIDILRNEAIAVLTKPAWPVKEDIITYFKT